MDFSSLFSKLEEGAVDAAKNVAINALQEAAKDAVEFVKMATPSITRYLMLLMKSEISQEEFKSLIMGLKDLAQLAGLTQAGLAAIEIEATRNAILKTVTSIALGSISKGL